MGQIAIVAYRPRPGKEELLLQLLHEHVPILRSQGLATDRAPIFMRASNGAFIEVFEWQSAEAISQAHANPVVGKLWQRFWEACECIPLRDLAETSGMFAGFEALDM